LKRTSKDWENGKNIFIIYGYNYLDR